MPLTLIPPGKRIKYVKGRAYQNRFYIARGAIAGRTYEFTTKTTDETAARILAARFEAATLENRVPNAGEEITFIKATEHYIAFKTPSEADQRRINRIAAAIGRKLVSEVTHADLVRAAELIFPGRKNETKNRWVIKPAASILHYAAENGWCEWKRIKKLEEGPVKTRAADRSVAAVLMEALEKEEAEATTALKKTLARKKRLLILWLFKHGNRISDPLRLLWEDHIFLQRKVYLLFIGKKGIWKEKPLDEEVFEMLANEPEKSGRVFPWETKSGIYKWLRPLCRKLEISFTPHMARHFVGTTLNASGEGLKTIMGALDHSDATSSLRYQADDIKIVRAGLQSLGKLVEKSDGSRRKA